MGQPKEMFFTMEEYHQRLSGLRSEMSKRGIDVLMSFTPENIYYMTGYQTPGYYVYQTLVVPMTREPFMVTRYLEETNVIGLSWLDDRAFFQDHEDPVESTLKALRERDLIRGKTIGIEENAWFISISQYLQLKGALSDAKVVDGSGSIESLRLIKSPQEIEYIRRAARVAEKGMQAGMEAIREGVTEDDIAAAVHYEVVRNGGEYMSLPPFICSGYRSGLAHATWGGRKIKKGDVVFFEISGCVKRYSAALMRTAFLGDPPEEVRKIAEVVIAGLTKAIETIRPGISSGDADKACRGVIAKAGYGEHYRHRLGYSIGTNFPPDWGEGHILSLRAHEPTLLKPNMTFHMPPAVLGYKDMGIGFSETIRVTDSGCETITNFERRLKVID
jgi:Xaa-Pro dipeptidase